jgi:hypothetical protein
MGLILIAVVLIAIGIIGILKVKDSDASTFFYIPLLFGIIFSFILLIPIIVVPACTYTRELVSYELLKQNIEENENNSIKDIEQINQVKEMNELIITNKIGRGNFWTGLFYNRRLAKKELLIIKKPE